ncbi:splicing factor [Tanacetum coccineum]
MEELKIISPEAYQYLIDRNLNTWCRAFFRQESKCPNFENRICKSFNRVIIVQRSKPIITMLEDIRIYIMQRLVAMNKVARTWENSITPSIRKRVEVLKEKQRMWQFSGILCVHSVAVYSHVNMNPIEGVDHCYSQEKWFQAYQFNIKPVFGSTM